MTVRLISCRLQRFVRHAYTQIRVGISLWVRASEQDILKQNLESVEERWIITLDYRGEAGRCFPLLSLTEKQVPDDGREDSQADSTTAASVWEPDDLCFCLTIESCAVFEGCPFGEPDA